jgi:hypothetical protein
MLRISTIVEIALLASAPAYASAPEAVVARCAETHSHFKVSDCLRKLANRSEAELAAADRMVEASISKSGQGLYFVEGAKDAFAVSNVWFEIYRKRECDFFAAMATGGNSADDLRFVCLAALDDERAGDLKWVSGIGTYTVSPVQAKGSNIGAILESCSNEKSSHVEQSECLRKLADNSDTELESAKAIVSDKLPKTGNDPLKSDPLEDEFYLGSASFEGYREADCEFYATMAMGGNGAHDLRSACLASLGAKESERLKWVATLR